MKTFVYIDAEYCFTCAMREGMVPNYRAILEMLSGKYPDKEVCAYFVGSKEKKKGVEKFLINIGIDFVDILGIPKISKIQTVGAQMAINVIEKILSHKAECNFSFITGDHYLIPIIMYLNRYGIIPDVIYFPLILSRGVEERTDNNLIRLTDAYFMFPKEK